MAAVFLTIDQILRLYTYVIILSAVFSWLYAFNIVNSRNQIVASIGRVLYQLTEPVYAPIRRILPAVGGLDLSPIVVLFAIYFIRVFLQTSIAPMFGVIY